MKLHGAIDLHVKGERILREPRFWDKLKKTFGGEPDLRTDKMRAALEAGAVVDATRRALQKLGATNAVSLVIDDQVLFQDREGKPDDLGDLFLAFSDNESVFGAGFKLLRLAVEHQEAGLHLVLEIVARTEHPLNEAAARIVVSGRVRDFEPRSGEDAETYRKRVEPLTQTPTIYEAHKGQFESFVSRVADAIRASMPEARVEIRETDALLQRPPRSNRPARTQPAPAPTDRRYDPYDMYYPNPFGTMLSVMMWSSIFSMAMPPHVVVINDHGDHLGTPADLGPSAANPDTVMDPADHGGMGNDMGGVDTDGDGVADTDFGDSGGDYGDSGGGDFGGGDFGGGDF
jgi:hypothetical protein